MTAWNWISLDALPQPSTQSRQGYYSGTALFKMKKKKKTKNGFTYLAPAFQSCSWTTAQLATTEKKVSCRILSKQKCISKKARGPSKMTQSVNVGYTSMRTWVWCPDARHLRTVRCSSPGLWFRQRRARAETRKCGACRPAVWFCCCFVFIARFVFKLLCWIFGGFTSCIPTLFTSRHPHITASSLLHPPMKENITK